MLSPPASRLTLRECEEKGCLEHENPHPRDARITFAEIGHRYFIDGVPHNTLHYLSSTTFIGEHFPKFDQDFAIRCIFRSRRYATDPDYKYYRMTEDTIRSLWKSLGDTASSLGSFFHISCEYHCNRMNVLDDPSPAYQQYLAFRKDHPHLVPFRTEMLIYDERYRIVGSVDAVFKNLQTHKFLIIDWKRSKKISGRGGDKGHFPVEHLKSNNLTKYSLQLSLYTYILSRNYNMNMENSALVVCHPTQDTYQYIQTKYMLHEIQDMLSYRLVCLHNKKAH